MHLRIGCKISQPLRSHQQTSIARQSDYETELLAAVWTGDGLTLLIPHNTCLWYELVFDSQIRSYQKKKNVANNTTCLSWTACLTHLTRSSALLAPAIGFHSLHPSKRKTGSLHTQRWRWNLLASEWKVSSRSPDLRVNDCKPMPSRLLAFS